MRRIAFANYHPVVNFLFFIAAVVCAVVFFHPAFVAVSVVCSLLYLILVRHRKALRLILGLAIVWAIITVCNPLIDPNGQMVLFTWVGGRHYTLEALYYGMALGGIFVSVISWFAAYNSVMSSDKFLYLFGRFVPSVSLVLTMVLRLVPNFKKKALQIAAARKTVGKAGSSGKTSEKLENAMAVVSALTGWALEGGIIMADSMRCRGYGIGERSTFSIYRFIRRDAGVFALMAVLLAGVIFCGVHGAARTQYVPVMDIAGVDQPYTMIGLIAFAAFLLIPTVIHLAEAVRWHILKSGI